jgi:hypothetical protein
MPPHGVLLAAALLQEALERAADDLAEWLSP